MKAMKHAFLIIAHGKWEQLKILLNQIDSINHDIYIHIDAKIKNPPISYLKENIKFSNIKIFQKYKVYWGSFELVETELYLLQQSSNTKKYDYYHLLSGMDMLIKPIKEIDNFFERNNGYEFVHFDTNERIKKDKEILRRVKLYHYFTNYRRGFKYKVINLFFNTLAHVSLFFQQILNIDRTKKLENFEIKYGSQWFSITNNLVEFILQSKEKIYKIFKYTKCADELFVQSLAYNSKFKKRLFNQNYDDDCMANVRLIDLKKRSSNGSPYIWTKDDLKEIKETKCLFARKFDIDRDKEVIKEILKMNSYDGEYKI